jgi:xylulokinase
MIFKEAQKSCANDLIFIPYLAGRLSTQGYKSGFGEIYNLRIQHNRGDIFRSLLISLAFLLADMKDKCNQIAPGLKSVIIGGGGSRNDYFEKLKSSACQCTFNYTQTHELTLLGAAILAAKGINEESSWESLFKRMIHIKKTIEPDDKLIDFLIDYKKLFKEYNSKVIK